MFRYLIFFINFILFPTIASSHVQHYKNLQRVEFDIYRNNDLVGYHKVNIKKKGDNTKEVITDILIEVKISVIPYRDWETDRKSTRLNSTHSAKSRMPSSA